MQVTDTFSKVIYDHLQQLGARDPLFAETLKKANKNIKDCCTYILNQVKASGRNGYADEEVFGMAVHYYDEDDIKVGSHVKATVVVNQSLGKDAKTASAGVLHQAKPIAKKVKKVTVPDNQPSLF